MTVLPDASPSVSSISLEDVLKARLDRRTLGYRRMSGEAGLDIEALYQQYRVRIFRAVAGVVFDDAAAEDLTQETFERAWRARRSYRGGPEEAGAWLYRIAMNAAVSWLRRRRLARLLPTRIFLADDPGLDSLDRVENRHLADVALAALGPKLRVVVVMTYYSDLTQQEIASALGIPRGTVATRLAAAQKIMRAALAEQHVQPERRTGDEAGV
jgi:RNA polymerase sigma-70 factor, ECF subfamily